MYSMYKYTISLHHPAITHTIVVGRMTQVKREHAVRLILNINRMAIHRMADRAPRDKILKLNVGGVFYTTAKSTLTCVYGSYLWKIATGDLYVMRDEKGSLFIDRDGYVFRCVLLRICGILLRFPPSYAGFECNDFILFLRKCIEMKMNIFFLVLTKMCRFSCMYTYLPLQTFIISH